MAESHPDAEFIRTRADKLANTYNNCDVETALTMFAVQGVMTLNMDKQALVKFLGAMFTTLKTLELETVSVSGHKGFTAWEWKMHFTRNEGVSGFKDLDAKGSKEGGVLIMLGVSVTWWNEEGKIVTNHDYARFA